MTSVTTSSPDTYPALGAGSRLDFHGPMSPERATRLVAESASRAPATVVDYGSGWGELLLRILAAAPEAHGTGIDVHGPDIARARAAAAARGLTAHATFIEGPAKDHTTPADLVLNLGAYHAFGTIPEALAELRTLLNPGGRLLFGAEIWDRTPTEAELAAMWPGTTADECLYLPDLVDLAVAAGFRPLRIETATRAEWEEFESGYLADTEEWLLAHTDHPDAAEAREKLDRHRSIWLRGLRDVFSYAFFDAWGAVFEDVIGRSSGIGPMESDEAQIVPTELRAFVDALFHWRGRTTHAVMTALCDGFLTAVVALADRAGAADPDWDPHVLAAARELSRSMAR